MTVGLRSHSGYFRRTSVVALAIFSQYWYWYPLSYFLTLTLQPTALLGLNSELQMPKLQVKHICLHCCPWRIALTAACTQMMHGAASFMQRTRLIVHQLGRYEGKYMPSYSSDCNQQRDIISAVTKMCYRILVVCSPAVCLHVRG